MRMSMATFTSLRAMRRALRTSSSAKPMSAQHDINPHSTTKTQHRNEQRIAFDKHKYKIQNRCIMRHTDKALDDVGLWFLGRTAGGCADWIGVVGVETRCGAGGGCGCGGGLGGGRLGVGGVGVHDLRHRGGGGGA